MSDAVSTNQPAPAIRELIATLATGLAGRSTAYPDLVDGIKLRIAKAVLSEVEQAFIAKSRGGTGSDGVTWKPLERATIAARPIGPGDRPLVKGLVRKGAHPGRPFLSAAQDKRWRMIFATTKARMMGKFGLSESEAGARAGQAAWATLKREGGKTKLQVLGGRQVDIGRDSGKLLQSLTVDDPEAEGQILRTSEPGAIVVGSSVPYAIHFHRTRPLWSDPVPEAWNAIIAREARAGIVAACVSVLQGA